MPGIPASCFRVCANVRICQRTPVRNAGIEVISACAEPVNYFSEPTTLIRDHLHVCGANEK